MKYINVLLHDIKILLYCTFSISGLAYLSYTWNLYPDMARMIATAIICLILVYLYIMWVIKRSDKPDIYRSKPDIEQGELSKAFNW